MVVLVFGMLVSVVLAVAVVGLVAIPARREGRDLLTPKGEEVVALVREMTGSAVETALEKTGEAVGAARDKLHWYATRQARPWSLPGTRSPTSPRPRTTEPPPRGRGSCDASDPDGHPPASRDGFIPLG